MPSVQLGEGQPTLKSHGFRVARFHMHDWFIFILLVAVEIVLLTLNPFYRFVDSDMLTDLKYPLKDNTVPVWAVGVCSFLP